MAPTVAPDKPFTRAEQVVLRLVIDGLGRGAIARRLGVRPRTIQGHLDHINQKIPGNRPLYQRAVLWAAGYGALYLYIPDE